MSTLDPKPIKKVKLLNAKLLPIAALVLLVLALVFMATPLLRVSGVTGAGRTGFNRQFTGTGGFPGAGGFTGTPQPGGNGYFQGPPNANGSTTGTDGTTTNPTRRFGAGGARGVLGFGILSGVTGTIVYAIALLVSLAAAIGMFLTKKWGQVLGIVMAVIYLLLGLVSFLPTLLLGFFQGFNALSIGLSLLHLVLAIAVIVLASIPAKKLATIPAAPSETMPPAASA